MKFALTLLIFLSVNVFSAEEYQIHFGELAIAERINNDGYRFSFLKETNSVAIVTFEDGGIYGLKITPPNDAPYTIDVVAKLPNSLSNSPIKLQSVKVKGSHIYPLFFESGDPQGQYTILVTINGSKTYTINYNAYYK
jgi:hypothetical protein